MIPIYLVISLLFLILVSCVFKAYRARIAKHENLKHGIGRGVAGFQTGVRKIAIPPEIMERIRRGEEVSGEEITRAQERMAAASRSAPTKPHGIDEQWLPETNHGHSHKNSKVKQRKK